MAAELYWRGRKNDHLVAQRKTQWRLAHKSSAGKARSSGYKNEKGESMGQHHVRKSCVRFVVLSVSFSAVLSFTAQAATAPVGATPGSFSVDPNGGANYTIPIQIPPGSAGMAPSIALSYSKQVDNPLVGVGFSIFGLSIISRCGSTIALDGAKSGVYYDSRDRFCLDGQRLIAVNGAYGAHNTEYRTERESFAKIFSYNTSVCGLDNGAAPSSGPACFKVLSKDGTVSEYGVSPDSRIQAAPKNGVVQTTVRLWALNKVQDTRGNYYIVSYAEDNTNGEYRPVRIDYTGNANAALAPYNSVRFVYGPRTDIVPVYEAGSMIKVTQRLTNAQTYTDTTLVRDYRLGYDNNGAVGGSRLLSVTECGSDGVCLPGTTFSYQNGNTGFTLPNYNAPALPTSIGGYNSWNSQAQYMHVADFNGDGKLDYMWGPQNGGGFWLLAYGTGTGFTLPNPNAPALPASIGGYNSWNSQAQYMYLGDFNGDGKLDYMWGPQNGDGRWLIAYGTGTGFTLPDPNAPALPASIGGYNSWNSQAQYMHVADFNGDGKLDYMWRPLNGDGRWLIAYGTDTGFTLPDYNAPALPASVGGYNSWNNSAAYMYFADFNGDGKLDYMWGPQNGDGRWLIAYGTGTGFTLPSPNAPALPASIGGYNSWNNSAAYMYFGDFNGDGKLDYMWGPQNGDGRWLLAYGTGTGFTLPDPNAPALPASIGGYNSWNNSAAYMYFADFNGDGKLDYMWGPQNGDGRWLLAYGTGTGFTLPDPNAPALPASIGGYNSWNNSAAYMYFGDFDGNGKVDYMWAPQNGDGRWLMASSAGLTPDLLVNATTGLGVVTNITSKPLTDNSVYTKESGATYPYQDVQNATYVVSRVTQSDGIAGVRGTSYRYLGAKSHLTGPGWLGFRRMETTDELSGVVSITEYDQNYEAGTNGMPTLLQTKLAARTLKQVQNFWQGVATTDPAYPAASQVRFAKLNGTLEQNFEPNLVTGSDLISCVSADNTFGSYGDITQTIAKTDASCSFASAWVKTTTNTYCPGPEGAAVSNCPAPASRILGRLSRSQVTASASGVISQTRTSGFGYDSRGLLTTETIEPDEPASSTLRLATTHQYNEPYGNRTQSTVTGANPDGTIFSRTTSFGYDSRGRYVESTTNALGHPSQASHDARWGTVLSQTDPNNVTVSFGYDGFGRKISETRPDGTTTSIAYAACDALSNPCPSFGNGAVATYTVTTQSSGAAPATVYVDLLGRTLRTQIVSLNGAAVYRDTEYDNQGRIARSTLPYFAGAT